jgi:hypothetical protein
VYILTGIAPALRDGIGWGVITPGPWQKYFQARFISELRGKTPDLFIDAVAPDAFMWSSWKADYGYESDPEVRKFVEDNYILVDELTLVKGAKPVRFLARRDLRSSGRSTKTRKPHKVADVFSTVDISVLWGGHPDPLRINTQDMAAE